MSATDKKILRDAAQQLAESLRAIRIGAINVKRSFDIDEGENYNGGWNVNIATWSGQPTISLSFDKYLGRKSRHFWFGFWSNKRAPIDALLSRAPADLYPKEEFKNKDSIERNGIWVLKKTRTDAVSQPIAEYYEGEENDFWMYDIGHRLNVDRAVSFIAGIVDAVENDYQNVSLQLQQILHDCSIDQTTKTQLVQARLGQGKFRGKLLEHWGRACSVTGCTVEHVLRASHIKSWKDSSHKERLDSDNGFLLSTNLDALFDRHLISFDDDGRMLISDELTRQEIQLLGLSGELQRPLNARQKTYLAVHRAKHLGKTSASRVADFK